MTVYLDVGAARIQAWLGRSATLRGGRGASRMLAGLTREEPITAWLAGRSDLVGVGWNAEAGDVDGIVSLRLPDGTTDQRAAEVARCTLAHLRHGLPRVELQAAWAEAGSYVDAYPVIAHRIQHGDCVADCAQPRTIPIAKTCEDCGIDGVVQLQYHIAGDEYVDVCADCEARYQNRAAGRTTATRPDVVPGPERDLAGWLAGDTSCHHRLLLAARAVADIDEQVAALIRDFPDDSKQLATMAAGPDGRPGTHTALIYADGNQIGRFIRCAVKAGLDKVQLVGWITEANQAAVLAATVAMLDTVPASTGLPVSPHLIAGDDLLVSVPAMLAWPFIRTYLSTFSAEMAQRGGAEVETPTVSAGVVFAHQSYPFADVVRLAGDALSNAKRAVRGSASSVAWLDISQHGPTTSAMPAPVRATVIAERRRQVSELAGLPASLRAGLARAAHDGDERVRREVTRLDASAAKPFLDDPDLPIQQALELTRWWR